MGIVTCWLKGRTIREVKWWPLVLRMTWSIRFDYQLILSAQQFLGIHNKASNAASTAVWIAAMDL